MFFRRNAIFERARAECREILGDQLYNELATNGYINIQSRHYSYVAYRLRPGWRIEAMIVGEDAIQRWSQAGKPTSIYLCVFPTETMPDIEFLCQTYMRIQSGNEDSLWMPGHLFSFDMRLYNLITVPLAN